jgi:hypothetical protein
VPSMPDLDHCLNYLNELQDQTRYLMPAMGGFTVLWTRPPRTFPEGVRKRRPDCPVCNRKLNKSTVESIASQRRIRELRKRQGGDHAECRHRRLSVARSDQCKISLAFWSFGLRRSAVSNSSEASWMRLFREPQSQIPMRAIVVGSHAMALLNASSAAFRFHS